MNITLLSLSIKVFEFEFDLSLSLSIPPLSPPSPPPPPPPPHTHTPLNNANLVSAQDMNELNSRPLVDSCFCPLLGAALVIQPERLARCYRRWRTITPSHVRSGIIVCLQASCLALPSTDLTLRFGSLGFVLR